MWLSDKDIINLVRESDVIKNFEETSCEGATINLTLDTHGQVYSSRDTIIMGEVLEPSFYKEVSLVGYRLLPGETVTVQTQEYFQIPDNISGLIIERHSIRLMGLSVSPASYLNPGYNGTMSLVIKNENPVPVELVPGIKFCQLALFKLSSPSLKPYSRQDKRYQDSKEVQISKLHLDDKIQNYLKSKGISNISSDDVASFSEHLHSKVDDNVSKYIKMMKEKDGQ